MFRRLFSLAVAIAFAAPASHLHGQCVGPDNLTGPCWTPTSANLPAFPAFQIPGLGVCWDQCTPSAQNDIRVDWGVPLASGCAQFKSSVTVFDSTGTPTLAGTANMDYTRTWDEIDTNGNQFQVWRFVVKADIGPGPVGVPNPMCPVPSCVFPSGPHPTAFFYGYVDYAFDCSGGLYQQSLVLHHGCDHFIHKPGLSSRPGSFHPGRSYAIVAPHSSAMPFIPMNLPAPGGPLTGEALRNASIAGTVACITEDPIASGNLTPFVNACMCTLSLFPPQYTLSLFSGKGSCLDPTGSGSNFASQNIAFPTLPWVHLVTASIGCWGNDIAYPGKECAFVNEGLFTYHDACPQAFGDYFEVYYGSTTTDGWSIVPTPGTTASDKMIDMVDNFTYKVGTPAQLPLFGHVMPTEHLIYANVP